MRKIFTEHPRLGDLAETKQGLATTNNALFLRFWYEVDFGKIGLGIENSQDALNSKKKWFPINKGGGYRKWYGNNHYIVNFENDGQTICDYIDNTPNVNVKSNGRVINRASYYKPGLTWGNLSSGGFSMRYSPAGFLFETKGAMCFPIDEKDCFGLLSLMNSNLIDKFLGCICPTLDYHEGPLKLVPIAENACSLASDGGKKAVAISIKDCSCDEITWDFVQNSLLSETTGNQSLCDSWASWRSRSLKLVDELRVIEEANNHIFIEAYGLQSELSPEVPENRITLARANPEKDSQRLISYAVGCMMGRYSLDETGLIYAHAGNAGFDASRYKTFPADADGIVPITDELWFEDDATNRIREFLNAIWGPETLDENVAWLADSIGMKGGEMPQETIRRYLSGSFYKDHLQTYKKRPIYWHFSSGKQGAFQALVYLHRYQEGTLARMRAEYVVPLTGKMQSRIEMLEKDRDAANATAARTKIAKQIESLKKKHVELLAYDEKLRHYADMRIQLDLDDGVKVNYGKFGDLLAEVKAVTGGAGEG